MYHARAHLVGAIVRHVTLLVAVVAIACPAAGAVELTVFAAASLTEAFRDVANAFTRHEPATHIRFDFAGSQQLVAHLEYGAEADLLTTADERWMQRVEKQGRLAAAPRIFAHNRLVVIIPRENREGITTLADLARPGLRLVLAAQSVPAGRYSRIVLAKLASSPDFTSTYAEDVQRNVVSLEESVKGVVAKVQLGEADAGIVYASDVTPAVGARVRRIEIPSAANVEASYFVAAVKGGAHPAAARRFSDFLLDAEAQAILHRHGFEGAGSTPPEAAVIR